VSWRAHALGRQTAQVGVKFACNMTAIFQLYMLCNYIVCLHCLVVHGSCGSCGSCESPTRWYDVRWTLDCLLMVCTAGPRHVIGRSTCRADHQVSEQRLTCHTVRPAPAAERRRAQGACAGGGVASAAALAAAPDAAALVEPAVAALAAEQGRRASFVASSRCCALALPVAVCVQRRTEQSPRPRRPGPASGPADQGSTGGA